MLVRRAADFGIIARQRRQQLRMTQQELADRIGASRVWVYNFEGAATPGAELQLVFAALEALGLSVDLGTHDENDGTHDENDISLDDVIRGNRG